MTLKTHATAVIEIYRRSEQKQATGGGYAWNIDWLETALVLWIPQKSVIDADYMQKKPRHAAKVLTSDLAIYNLLTEQNTLLVYQADGTRYSVTGRKDVGGQGKCFAISVLEILTSEALGTIPLSGAVAGGTDEEGL
jgi:hypothetical protein